MELITVTHVKEAIERLTKKARIHVSRSAWPVIRVEVPFYHKKKVQALQECMGNAMRLEVTSMGFLELFHPDQIKIVKTQ